MMDIAAQIESLLGEERLPADGTGALRVVHDALRDMDPAVLWTSDAAGTVSAVYDNGLGAAPARVRALAGELAAQIGTRELCIRADAEAGLTGFILAAPGPAGRAMFLGGLLRCPAATAQRLHDEAVSMSRLASLALAAIEAARFAAALQTRVHHLEAEKDTLKASHAATVTSVIEEREQRIREQRAYVVHLENEVAKRSADLRLALDAANQANRAKVDFLANMSHEIRTPMTAIIGFAENLLSPNLTEAEKFDAVQTIRRNGDYLLHILNDMLDLSRIEAGRFEVEIGPCSPIEVVADVQSVMRAQAEAKGLRLEVEYAGPVPQTVQTDSVRLRQILFNLLANAVKFTEKGMIRLVSRFVGGTSGGAPCLQFDVIDTGIGIAEEQLPRLFQPFTQGDSSLTRRFGGNGLGLAVGKRLAEQLGGTITVESRLGQGSTFRLSIATGPVEGVKMVSHPGCTMAVRPDDGVGDPHRLHNCRILLAEDGPDNQRLIAFVLRKAGAEVTLAENGRVAIDKALAARDEGRPFDVILMDMQMPVLDGFGAASLLRQKKYTGPIIALTAHTTADDREKCIRAGCTDHASKPIDRATLIETILAQLRSRAD